MSKHTNRLADATSPYLLQHAHNPVDWFPWGEEALARARDEGKPSKDQAAQLAAYLRENAQAAPGGAVGEEALRQAAEQLGSDFDERWGGFGPAPKFPPSGGLSLLLRVHRRFGDERALAMVRKTLEAMARGGMYDQVGGGFARYSTDVRWLVPHFEKMLYDNAQLARAYLEGHQATGYAYFREVAEQVIDYVLRDMTDPSGGFYSTEDADSEGEEGKFYVWRTNELRQ